ncbi:MAG: peptidoglycan-associated lipoprotein Pal [Deltaproteobacteria bacterium]|nr:peptidoglycan-associated lipoprotein Pal [Deltaproteobacteria bacterium]
MRKGIWLVLMVVLAGSFLASGCASRKVSGDSTSVPQPQPEPVVVVEQETIEIVEVEDPRVLVERELRQLTIHFDFDSSDLKPEARANLQLVADTLKANQTVRVLIEGHCDERGTEEYNLALGERRARAAREFLVLLGVELSRTEILSYGEERPVASGHNETAWSQNRRAEFKPIQ